MYFFDLIELKFSDSQKLDRCCGAHPGIWLSRIKWANFFLDINLKLVFLYERFWNWNFPKIKKKSLFFQEKNFVRNLEFWFGFSYLNRENTSTCFIRPSNDIRKRHITWNDPKFGSQIAFKPTGSRRFLCQNSTTVLASIVLFRTWLVT